MKKFILGLLLLKAVVGFGQEKPIKSYDLFGVKFSVDKKLLSLLIIKIHFNIKKNL
jgi:hypothetical protein